jgi:hypothetical protein
LRHAGERIVYQSPPRFGYRGPIRL